MIRNYQDLTALDMARLVDGPNQRTVIRLLEQAMKRFREQHDDEDQIAPDEERKSGPSDDPKATDINGVSSLMTVVEADRADAVERLIAEGADVNLRDKDGQSALLLAAMNGRLPLVTRLLESKAEIDPVDFKGDSPLTAAIKHRAKAPDKATRNRYLSVVKLLLDKGADPHRKDKASFSCVSQLASDDNTLGRLLNAATRAYTPPHPAKVRITRSPFFS